ncbi:MAG: diaminopimelate decarboxylase [Rickettsiales bacterium]|jgi:diaminopimelate decarboxylase|nr:diaminopimelate decarboxylase [Rickettsiales bacterium]
MLEKVKYKSNELYFDDVKVSSIVEKFGSPLYIYSKNRIIENYESYDSNFKKNNIINYCIHYAIKANENLSILKLLGSMGAGADTVSGNEVKKSLLAGIPPDKIVFSGVSKSRGELEFAIRSKIGQINIESYEEFLNIREIVKEINMDTNIAVRVNPDIDADTHMKITTGKRENKFGVPFEIAEKIYNEAKPNDLLNFKGVSVHIGSQILNINKFEEVLKFLSEVYKKYSWQSVDLGGGLGIEYETNQKTPSKEEFVALIRKYFGDYKGKIMIEPGRSIVGDAGIFVCKVICTKETDTKNFIMVDGGFNGLIRPAMYDAYHHPLLSRLSGEKKVYDIVGSICESGDIFNRDIELDVPDKSSCIAFLSAGAYGRSMASNYNLHDIVGEVWVEEGQVEQIRKSISFEDLLKFEEV